MIITVKSPKVGIREVRGVCKSLPEGCIPALIHSVRRNGHKPEWESLTPKAKDYVDELVYACNSGSISRVCEVLYKNY